MPPGTARQLVKLFPVAFVPSRHSMLDRETSNLLGNTFASSPWMRALPIRFTSLLPRNSSPRNGTDVRQPIHILHKPAGNAFSLPVVSNTLPDEWFPGTGRGTERGASRSRTTV